MLDLSPWFSLFVATPLMAVLVLAPSPVCAAGAKADARETDAKLPLPGPLEPWRDWVLLDSGDALCAFRNGDLGARTCAWPGVLALTLTHTGATFEQSWALDRPAVVSLPGDAHAWPLAVTVDGLGGAVLPGGDGTRPVVYLPAGRHRIAGTLVWGSPPDVLHLPAETGLLDLTVDGKVVVFPNRDAEGRLWLQQTAQAVEAADRLELTVHRRLDDDLPFILETRIDLQVSGRNREILLGPVLPADFVPVEVEHPLPARLEPDGRLRIQARAGSFAFTVRARHVLPVAQLTLPAVAPEQMWVAEEVWALVAHPDLRQVLLGGAPAVDPSQTRLPEAWRALPSYLVKAGETVTLTEQRRGDPTPPPDRLSLQRELWLDAAGTGFTVRDHLTGDLANAWRLEMPAPLVLGHVTSSGRDQLITRQKAGASPGVELREGRLDLVADSRLEGGGRTLPAVGWDQDFQSVDARLHLPPGWRLFDAQGIDDVPDTWLRTWSLLDLFLLLVVVLATAHLFGRIWGAVALLALALAFPEADAPRVVWLFVLGGEALRRVLPSGKAARFVTLYRGVAGVSLALIVLPFLVHQVRVAMYPALERPWDSLGDGNGYTATLAPRLEAPAQNQDEKSVQAESDLSLVGRQSAGEQRNLDAVSGGKFAIQNNYKGASRRQNFEVDPQAAVQTGPGVPRWAWNAAALRWNGPVQRSQTLSLTLLPPPVNLALAWLRAVLVGLLAACVLGGVRRLAGSSTPAGPAPAGPAPPSGPPGADTSTPAGPAPPSGPPGAAPSTPAGLTVLACLFAATALSHPRSAGAEIPTQEMLESLETRLLTAPPCAPHCAALDRLRLEIAPDRLTGTLEISAAAETAVALPGGAGFLDRVLLDGVPATVLRDPTGTLYLRVSPGHHVAWLSGPLPARETVDLPLPTRPHRVEATARGWSLSGVDENGLPAETLQLTRQVENRTGAENADAEGAPLAAFAEVSRTLSLGLAWTAETRVLRTSPAGVPLVLSVPLLPGESVTTAEVKVESGRVLVNLGPNANQTSWQSVLTPAQTIDLVAPSGVPFVEVWSLDVGPIWHVETEGIPVVRRRDESGGRLPTWRPYPGEKVTLTATRPSAVEGQTLTLDRAQMTVTPGLRATDSRLELDLRSSRGGHHTLTLPAGAAVQSVQIGGQNIPFGSAQAGASETSHRVELPLSPGLQTAIVTWQTTEGLDARYETPRVGLGAPAVNLDLRVELPAERWLLFAGGPRQGPAILFWSELLVLIALSIFLGRSQLTPLRWYHWLGLSMGISQAFLPAALIVVGWLFALGLRAQRPFRGRGLFNLGQLALVGWTLAAFVVLFFSIRHGLLGLPQMQVEGNGSDQRALRWFLDRSEGETPTAWLVSVPLMAWRLLMLAWALWLARALLRWLRWGWRAFSVDGLWRSAPPPPPPLSPVAPVAPVEGPSPQ